MRLPRCAAQVLRGVFVKYYDRVAIVRLREIFLSTARPCERGARYGGGPYKSPKIAENRAICGDCGSLAARAADTSSTIAELLKKCRPDGGSPRFSRTSEGHS